MKILVTGATGYIGGYVITLLLERDHKVIATSSSEAAARQKPWFDKVDFVEHNIHSDKTENLFKKFHSPDLVIHLAWGGLANFKDPSHIEKELPKQQQFLLNLIENGLKDLAVTGTCLEYGMREGELREDMETNPTIAYPIAKDLLRKNLEDLRKKKPFAFKWIRLFYMYGEGQTPKSIIPQLQKALAAGEPSFNMSGGEQTRDYLPVERVASNIVAIALQNQVTGIINAGSGHPITVKQLVQDYIKSSGKTIRLNLGFYPYPDYEPMHFWSNASKLNSILSS
jgi:nucleoside-diphosphate-sugar epimerase